jgi:hypothetical protein
MNDVSTVQEVKSYRVPGIVGKNIMPFMGVQFDKPTTLTVGVFEGHEAIRHFRIITYQAYNAFGLIGSECNGVAVLDEDQHRVLCDEIGKESTGYFGVSQEQVKTAKWLASIKWGEFKHFINNHPRARYKI